MTEQLRAENIVIGAGLAGITLAERIASRLGEEVLVLEKRPHIGGNVYDEPDPETGILVHRYGPHTFHTDDEEVFSYITSFTKWHDYEHRVLSHVDGQFVPIPICLTTLRMLYDPEMTEEGMHKFLEARRIPMEEIRTSEDVALSQVGQELYERFFRSFTRKQWGVDPSELDASVLRRIPLRFNEDDRYFTDRFQGSPEGGYTQMCRKMLDHPLIRVETGVDYREVARRLKYKRLIYTGPLDGYFDNCLGPLKWRSIRFLFENHAMASYQPGASTRWPMEHEYTRITEFKKMTGQESPYTSILKEIPCDMVPETEGDPTAGKPWDRSETIPFYTFPTPEEKARAEKYRALAEAERGKNIHFVGRLAEYRYYDMDDVVRRALSLFEEEIV